MPTGDGTGPFGEGQMTGKAMGRCAGYPSGGYDSAPGPGAGRRFAGSGLGGGRGYRNRFYQTGLPLRGRFMQQYPPRNTEFSDTDSLKRQLQNVSDTLGHIASRVKQLLEQGKDKNT